MKRIGMKAKAEAVNTTAPAKAVEKPKAEVKKQNKK